MPKSKVRKKPTAATTGSGVSRAPIAVPDRGPSPTWFPWLLGAIFLIGLAYIVVYYLAGNDVPGMRALGNWNLAVGFGVLVVGLIASVRWR